MRKVIASLVSVSLIVLSAAPAPAQVPQKIVRGVKAITRSGVQKTVAPHLALPSAARGFIAPAGAASGVLRPGVSVQPDLSASVSAALPQENLQDLRLGVETIAVKAVMGEQLTYAQIRDRVARGNTRHLAARILSYPNESVRKGMLRNEFVQAALAGNASAGQISRAAEFWRTDLASALEAFSTLPEGDLNALFNAYAKGNAAAACASEALADAAALGLFGAEKDAELLLAFYRKAAATPLEPLAAATAARALLRLGAAEELSALAEEAAPQPELWNGILAYAQTHGIALQLPAQSGASAPAEAFRPALEKFGKVNVLAADPSAETTRLYMNLGRTAPAARPATAQKNTPEPAISVPELPALNLADPAALQAGALDVPAGESVSCADASGQAQTLTALQQAAQRTGLSGTRSFQFLARSEKPAADNSGVLYGGIPVPALWQNAKKAFAAVKKAFVKKPSGAAPVREPASGLAGTFQRASLYLAAAVMGLEVATPVIANFGTSFGLSLSDNILVAVATYLPYSVGAFFSNWLKGKIGRKASMNIGLALMGGGFSAGVLLGLDGSFIPWADTMAHFYSILASITTASTGGVLVHNAVGPMMTDLSAGAGELSLQKRNANTELSRALGMAASFAFPFLATKVMGMDWSFTFALPIPLVAAAALGINLAKIPNTKPVLEPKAAPVPAAAQSGQRNRRAYQLTSSFQNNSYIRLFKEEKGVAALLTGLFIMNAVEMSFNNGFLFLLPSLTNDPSSQYLFGLTQFAAPFLLGRYLAGSFLKWFPKHNMSVATLLAAAGGLAALPLSHNVYALTAALFAAETGISTAFTLAFARTAKNNRTQDRVISLIVASAISCAFGPMLLTNLAEGFMNAGLFSSAGATTAALIGVPSALSLLSAALFRRIERTQAAAGQAQAVRTAANGPGWFKKLLNRLRGNKKPLENN